MKKIFRAAVNKVKEWWASLFKKSNKYFGLGPITEIEDSKDYNEMLDSAFKNGCINIAITGPYGSGKSSVLKSYIQSKNRFRRKQFISISLAAFKTELEETAANKDDRPTPPPKSPQDSKSETIKKLIEQKKFFDIEKSILQQLFYRTKRNKLYNSRFRKIGHTSIYFIILGLLVTILVSALIFTIVSPSNAKILFNRMLDNLYEITVNPSIAVSFLILGIMSTIIIIALIIRFFVSRFRVSELSVNSASITFDKNDSSIFNKYLDEIIYFFEVTNCKVVIIEDLDRFENISISIFTKLRELNRLINNSMQIKQEVTFIYAIKDGLFNSDDERTKFFDFIVPVIPVINYSNSADMFTKLLIEAGLEKEFDKSYIQETLRYFDDMRILKNTLNEYIFYKNKMSRHKNEQSENNEIEKNQLPFSNEKLISLLFYKNLNPEDFEAAQKNDGILYGVFENKSSAINTKISELNKEVEKLDNDIESIEKEHLTSLSELSYIFKGVLLSRLSSASYIDSITIDSARYTIGNVNEAFDFNILDNFSTILISGNRNLRVSKEEFDNDYKGKYSFGQRKYMLIEVKEKSINDKREEIDRIKKQLTAINELSIKAFIEKFDEKELFKNITNSSADSKILKFFIRNGYIDEYYINIVSLFYDVNLTRSDFNFILSVQDEIGLKYNYKLTYCKEIVERLDNEWFNKKAILNYDLLSYLLKNDLDNEKLDRLLKFIGNKETFNFDFIDSYIQDRIFDVLIINNGKTKIVDNIDVNIEIQKFVNKLCSLHPQIWIRLIRNIKKDYAANVFYMNLIINYADDNDLLEIKRYVVKDEEGKVIDSFTKSISLCNDFLFIFAPEYIEKAKFVVKELNIKFEELNNEKVSHSLELYKLIIYDLNKDLLEYIYENNHYKINHKMIMKILKAKSKLLIIDSPNYINILESEYKPLINYINDNIKEYIKNVLLSISENEENNEAIEKLINMDDVSEDLRIEVIKACKFDAYNLNNYDDSLWASLISEKRLHFYWDNVFAYYEKFGADKILIEFLNKNLSSSSPKLDVTDEKYEVYSELFDKLVTTDTFIDEKIKYFIVPNKIYRQLDVEDISEGKMDILMESGVIPLNGENYEYIRINYRSKLIKLLSCNEDQYKNEVDAYSYTDDTDNDIANDILISKAFSNSTKFNLIKYLNTSTDYTCENINVGITIIQTIFKVKPIIQLHTTMRDSILALNIGQENKIRLLKGQLTYLEKDEIKVSLSIMEGEFKKMVTPWQIGKLPQSKKNIEFVDKLNKLKVVSSYKIKNTRIHVHPRRK